MKSDIRVAAPPRKPLMIFDGDCNFCTLWIRRWQQMTGDAVDYLPSQDASVAAQFPEIPRERFQTAVQLIETDGSVYSGAEAVFRALAKNPKWGWSRRAYEKASVIARITEFAYGFIAGHRTFFSRLTRWFWGRHVELPDYFLTRWIFLRALGAIYLVAFISLWTQIIGLIGHNGILPADQFMSAVQQQCTAQGIGVERFHLLPTLCWFNSSDYFLNFQCAAGTFFALLLIIGIAPAPCLTLLWLLYLSLATVGQDFLGYQWDNLLLETGFLAIFLALLQLLRPLSHESPPSRIVLWLLRLLLFKLIFSSGCVKLLSADPNWRNLTALTFHYQTQPLPTWIGWYANQLPAWAQKASALTMFGIELFVPFLIFAPRRLRRFACLVLVVFQALIFLTGNYCFFNLLMVALCLLLLDDAALKACLPATLRNSLCPAEPPQSGTPRDASLPDPQRSPLNRWKWPVQITVPLAAIAVVISLLQFSLMFRVPVPWPRPLLAVYEWLEPFRSFNSYGLFAVMTTSRSEIIIEGSDDGVAWRAYEFKYKPGDVKRRPKFVEPHQPRLDWQMWFAALGTYRQNPWLVNFCVRLLQGSPHVLGLLERNPFPNAPPRYIQA